MLLWYRLLAEVEPISIPFMVNAVVTGVPSGLMPRRTMLFEKVEVPASACIPVKMAPVLAAEASNV